jgi:flagellar basal body-associated protein FliL
MTKKASHRSARAGNSGGDAEHPRARRRKSGIPIWVSVLVVVFLLIVGGLAMVFLMG